jgi:hypothetical protein
MQVAMNQAAIEYIVNGGSASPGASSASSSSWDSGLDDPTVDPDSGNNSLAADVAANVAAAASAASASSSSSSSAYGDACGLLLVHLVEARGLPTAKPGANGSSGTLDAFVEACVANVDFHALPRRLHDANNWSVRSCLCLCACSCLCVCVRVRACA